MQSKSDKDELNVPYAQISSALTLRHFNVGYLVPVMLLLVVLFTCRIDSGPAYAASQETVIFACQPSTPASTTETTPLPTSTPILLPSSPGQEFIEKRAWQYIAFVIEGRCLDAYGILSPELRAQEPFSDYEQDQNYTLFQGCWTIADIFSHQSDSQNGIVNIELANVSCDNGSPIAYYDWILRFRLELGQWEIVAIGLYPAAPGN